MPEHAGNRGDRVRQARGIVQVGEMAVEHDIALIGAIGIAAARRDTGAPSAASRAATKLRANGSTSTGTLAAPMPGDSLRAVGDDDHPRASGGDDLLAQHRPARALDRAAVARRSRRRRRSSGRPRRHRRNRAAAMPASRASCLARAARSRPHGCRARARTSSPSRRDREARRSIRCRARPACPAALPPPRQRRRARLSSSVMLRL